MREHSARLTVLTAVALCVGASSVARAQEEEPPLPPAGTPMEPPLLGTIPDPPDVTRLEVGGATPLTLGQVLTSVERHHPNVTMAMQAVRAAEGGLLAAEGGFDLGIYANAFVSATGYYQYGYGGVRLDQPTPFWGTTFSGGWRYGQALDDPDGIPSYRRDLETLGGGELWVGVRVPLWRDGPIDSRRARLWQAEQTRDATQLSFEARMIALRLAASVAYWNWVAAGQRYLVREQLLALAEVRDAQIRARVRAGAIPAIEALENQRVILSRRRSLVSARRDVERASYTLSLFTRGDEGEPRIPTAERIPTEMPPAAELLETLAQAIEGAWQRRPDLVRYRALLERSRVGLELAENRFAPRIDLSLRGSVDVGDGSERQLEQYSSPVLEGSVLISFPLQFREARGGTARERAGLEALRAEAQLARERVAAEVQDAYSAVRAAEEAVELARAAAQVALAVADAERRRFELGATQLFIVNLREQAAAEAQVELVSAEALVRAATAQWEAATAAASVNR